jgi:hypothetical protein
MVTLLPHTQVLQPITFSAKTLKSIHRKIWDLAAAAINPTTALEKTLNAVEQQ